MCAFWLCGVCVRVGCVVVTDQTERERNTYVRDQLVSQDMFAHMPFPQSKYLAASYSGSRYPVSFSRSTWRHSPIPQDRDTWKDLCARSAGLTRHVRANACAVRESVFDQSQIAQHQVCVAEVEPAYAFFAGCCRV